MEQALRDFVKWFDEMRRTDEGKAYLLTQLDKDPFGVYDRAVAVLLNPTNRG